MMQLRRLSEVTLQQATKTKQPNGYSTSLPATIGTYKVIVQTITDEVSGSIYGANVNNMLRLSSVRGELESFLSSKITDGSDNLSQYSILIGNKRYGIIAVNSRVDVEFLETCRT